MTPEDDLIMQIGSPDGPWAIGPRSFFEALCVHPDVIAHAKRVTRQQITPSLSLPAPQLLIGQHATIPVFPAA